MSAKLFRNVVLAFSLLVMLTVAVAAFARHKAVVRNEDECCMTKNRHNTELPWESVARQMMGSIFM